jgi:uncharacterized protein YjbJ (UPF0337 family)
VAPFQEARRVENPSKGADLLGCAPTSTRRLQMGIFDKAKDEAEELEGKVKQEIGKHTDDQELQNEGAVDETKGDLKQAGEKVKDALD